MERLFSRYDTESKTRKFEEASKGKKLTKVMKVYEVPEENITEFKRDSIHRIKEIRKPKTKLKVFTEDEVVVLRKTINMWSNLDALRGFNTWKYVVKKTKQAEYEEL